ncbi:MAG: hypothetical protein DWQ09_09115 [Proteobacteria bacterium]|nr:MAG: hypothetical protein DWQ09_09115 [Pseudomonadota bacterium]QKK10692.1 MAG: hypothetical protein HND59_02870 [Pseudomonadota bacterium]
MKVGISLSAVGQASSIFLLFTFLLCVGFDLLFPQWAMFESWRKLLPGFEWISWRSVLVGAVEAYGYGWFFALIWVPLYNFFANRAAHGAGA